MPSSETTFSLGQETKCGVSGRAFSSEGRPDLQDAYGAPSSASEIRRLGLAHLASLQCLISRRGGPTTTRGREVTSDLFPIPSQCSQMARGYFKRGQCRRRGTLSAFQRWQPHSWEHSMVLGACGGVPQLRGHLPLLPRAVRHAKPCQTTDLQAVGCLLRSPLGNLAGMKAAPAPPAPFPACEDRECWKVPSEKPWLKALILIFCMVPGLGQEHPSGHEVACRGFLLLHVLNSIIFPFWCPTFMLLSQIIWDTKCLWEAAACRELTRNKGFLEHPPISVNLPRGMVCCVLRHRMTVCSECSHRKFRCEQVTDIVLFLVSFLDLTSVFLLKPPVMIFRLIYPAYRFEVILLYRGSHSA